MLTIRNPEFPNSLEMSRDLIAVIETPELETMHQVNLESLKALRRSIRDEPKKHPVLLR